MLPEGEGVESSGHGDEVSRTLMTEVSSRCPHRYLGEEAADASPLPRLSSLGAEIGPLWRARAVYSSTEQLVASEAGARWGFSLGGLGIQSRTCRGHIDGQLF